MTDLLEVRRIIDPDLVDFSDQVELGLRHVDRVCTLEVVTLHRNNEVVLIPSTVDPKAALVGFVGDAVTDTRSEHHLVAAHVVRHDILELGQQGLRIHEVEVDLVVGGDLDTLVAAYEVDEASDAQFKVLPPLPAGCSRAISELLSLSFPVDDTRAFFVVIIDDDAFEEEDLRAAACNEGPVIVHVHLTKVLVGHPLNNVVAGVLAVDRDRLALPIECIELSFFDIGEGLVREVLGVAVFDLVFFKAVQESALGMVNDEMVVLAVAVVEQRDGDLVIIDEGAVDERVIETFNRHRVVVDAQELVQVVVLLFANLNRTFVLVEDAQDKLPVVVVDDGILVAGNILLDLFCPDEAVFAASDDLSEAVMVIVEKVELADEELLVGVLGDGDDARRVVRNDARNDGVVCRDMVGDQERFEVVLVILELNVGAAGNLVFGFRIVLVQQRRRRIGLIVIGV